MEWTNAKLRVAEKSKRAVSVMCSSGMVLAAMKRVSSVWKGVWSKKKGSSESAGFPDDGGRSGRSIRKTVYIMLATMARRRWSG